MKVNSEKIIVCELIFIEKVFLIEIDRSSDGLNIGLQRVFRPRRVRTRIISFNKCSVAGRLTGALWGFSRVVFSYAIKRGDLILIYIKGDSR